MSKGEKASEWPFGDLIRQARGKMSQRQAAVRAGFSASRWRQIEQGYQEVAGGNTAPVRLRPRTAVAAAWAVGADPAEALRLAGLDPEESAELLENPGPVAREQQMPPQVERLTPVGVQDWFIRLPAKDRPAVLAALKKMDEALNTMPDTREDESG